MAQVAGATTYVMSDDDALALPPRVEAGQLLIAAKPAMSSDGLPVPVRPGWEHPLPPPRSSIGADGELLVVAPGCTCERRLAVSV